MFKLFKAKIVNRLGKKNKAIIFECGGEYYYRSSGSSEQRPRPFAECLAECGIVAQYTMLGTLY